jgi:hypothetical protein
MRDATKIVAAKRLFGAAHVSENEALVETARGNLKRRQTVSAAVRDESRNGAAAF